MADKQNNPTNVQQNRNNPNDRSDQNRSGKQSPSGGSMDQNEQRRTAGKDSNEANSNDNDRNQSNRNRDNTGRTDH